MDKSIISPNGAQYTVNERTNETSNSLQGPESSKDAKETGNSSVSNGLLSHIPFLRLNSERKLKDDLDKDVSRSSSAVTQHENSASTTTTSRVRSRQGSLRKAALLSLGKNRSDKEKKSQAPEIHGLKIPPNNIHAHSAIDDSSISPSPDLDDRPTPRVSVDDDNIFHTELQEGTTSEESLLPPSPNRFSRQRDASTTDEDESNRTFTKLQIPDQKTPVIRPVKEEYFSSGSSLPRRHASRARSPLSAVPPIEMIPIPEEWDYSETEWWGWVILVITWVVFVMGMGSCFEVWSWAWAVGKTPYAPPELEDDPTLPIVGYYPALIILTGVMAWIWVFTAWVGMKYFRHAKIS